MPTFSLPRGCKGLDFADGTKVNATRAGKITLDDRHAKNFRQDGNYAHLGTTGYAPPRGTHSSPENRCPSCDFSAWPWTSQCPRCGTVLPLKTKPAE